MASVSKHVILLVLFISCAIMTASLFKAGPASAGWTVYPPFQRCLRQFGRVWNDTMAYQYGDVHRISIVGWYQLRC